MKLITPQIKDEILSDLISLDEGFFSIEYNGLAAKYDISFNQSSMVISQFVKMGFFENKGEFNGGGIVLSPTMYAHDFVSRGGFYAQEEILKANIDKLGFELEILTKELEPKYLEKIKSITSIANNIASFLNLSKLIN